MDGYQAKVSGPRAVLGDFFLWPWILVAQNNHHVDKGKGHDDSAYYGKAFSQLCVARPQGTSSEEHQEVQSTLYRRLESPYTA